MTRVLVCGPRFYGEHIAGKCHLLARDERFLVYDTLDTQHLMVPITVLIHGACMIDDRMSGADRWAHMWAKDKGIFVNSYPINHALDGPWPAAGPRRNRRMLEQSEPDRGIAFMPPIGTKKSGTLGMVDLMERAGLDVLKVPDGS